jgi:hypothetical protein
MEYDCFYKFKVITLKPDRSYYFQKKTDDWYYGYYPYKWILEEINNWYKAGADAVVLEMITQKQFDQRMHPN